MIFNMSSGGGKKCPVLDENYPESVSINATESATFQVKIAEDGKPNAYTYQWYENGNVVEGATSATYIRSTTKNDGGEHIVWCEVTSEAGTVVSTSATLSVDDSLLRTPEFTYSGTYALTNDSGTTVAQDALVDNWKLTFKTGGTLKFTKLNSAAKGIDVFCVGGGGGSGLSCSACYCGGGGGGGGYTNTVKKVAVAAGTPYTITIGSGGGAGSGGGTTSALTCAASGGNAGGTANVNNGWNPGGSGGSGGGAGSWNGNVGGAGGSNGGNGGNRGDRTGGSGQGTTTAAFGESGRTLYSAGGSGQGDAHGGVNTGNGGSAYTYKTNNYGTSGGSGIAIIRNTRS